ncbi:MAG: ABC transporter substrate-binding protein [Bacteriovoracaceae bacterium]|nr:ABC transporter substrate-binding protein [Bacteriovoracaceae bacterium]
MNKKYVYVILLLTGVFAIMAYYFKGTTMKNRLIVGFPVHWGKLVPSLQHTAYADDILGNQFEALVSSRTGGMTVAEAAKEWNISEDFKVYTFVIDNKKKFSNGKELTAEDFKRSWEEGLKLPPESANSSLQDVMYRVVGYEEFSQTGTLKGVKVLDKYTIEVRFKEPFRMALDYFVGSRLAAYIEEGGRYYGTGPFVITEQKERTLLLVKNPHYAFTKNAWDEILIKVIPTEKAESSLMNKEIDLYLFAELAEIKSCMNKKSEIGCFSGGEGRNQVLVLNPLKGHIFENEKFRMALQSLIHSELNYEILPNYHKVNLTVDPQVYLPVQAGRLQDEVASKIISEGAKYIDEFINASKANPIFLVTSESSNWVQEMLEKKGVEFQKKSGKVTIKDRVKMFYKTFEPDIMVGSFSVANGDPDGVYHVLGKDGSIASPLVYREDVTDLLEVGRKILDLAKINEHYQQVARAVLKEVPFVHLGYVKTITAYRKDRVRPDHRFKEREEGLIVFEPNQ